MSTFLSKTGEKLKMMQYWYSEHTINAMVNEVQEHGTRVAFLSTPSVYYSLTDNALRNNSKLFEYDDEFSQDENFVKYDYKEPHNIPSHLHHTFDMVVIDPPQITKDVWEQYATAAKLLLIMPGKEDQKVGTAPGKVLLSTVYENSKLMQQLLGCMRCQFRPVIPNLMWQYSFYVNYHSPRLDQLNSEIDTSPSPLNSRKPSTYAALGSEAYTPSDVPKDEPFVDWSNQTGHSLWVGLVFGVVVVVGVSALLLKNKRR